MANEVIKIEASNKTVELKVSTTQLVFNNFLSGLAWGLGSVVGATVIVSLILVLLAQLNTAPIIGKYISSILNYINATPTTR